MPAGKAREIGADRVLAVDVTRCIKTIEQPQNIFDVLYRAEILFPKLSVLRLREADIIRPSSKTFDSVGRFRAPDE